jgi:SNF2 family DNA or RNA helicase
MHKQFTWQQEQEALENAFARQLLLKYNIKEVTTQRQALNGTREFEFPVPSHPKYYKGNLRLACFKSGTVRKQNGTYSPYQLNKQYKQNRRTTFLTENGLETNEYIGTARALIWSQLARMNYMLEYYLKNYKISKCEYSGLPSTDSYTT